MAKVPLAFRLCERQAGGTTRGHLGKRSRATSGSWAAHSQSVVNAWHHKASKSGSSQRKRRCTRGASLLSATLSLARMTVQFPVTF